jgi:predicted alpha-1,2-mannosidase
MNRLGTRALLLPLVSLLLVLPYSAQANEESRLTDYVNPFIGSEPLLDPDFIGYEPPDGWRVWAGLTHPGPALPFAMVQMSPITEFGTGSGYQYEDDFILAFTHTNMGHWNYAHIPVIPVAGPIDHDRLGSGFSKDSESATAGFYEVFLDDYGIKVELTSTLRTGAHRYTYPEGETPTVVFDLSRSNERVRNWEIRQVGDNAISGYQNTGRIVHFYAEFDQDIADFQAGESDSPLSVATFSGDRNTVTLNLALSYVSIENAKNNFEVEAAGRSFDELRSSASATWEQVLRKITVSGGTAAQREQFYSGFYRSFLFPHLRSDVNGDYRDVRGDIVRADFTYYATPALWDTFRNKLVLMGTLFPDVTTDIIRSLIDRGEKRGFLPNYFHGDQATTFIVGSYLRGIRDFDVEKAYELMLRNATTEGGPREYIEEYMERGYITTPHVENPDVGSRAKAAVTKTLEYAYDDFALALMAEQLGDEENYEHFMERSGNYRNLFDPSTGLMRGRLESGDFVEPFNPFHPHYYYMYREANAWNASFFVPHDTEGLIALYESEAEFEHMLDQLFSIPWNPEYIARNMCCFLGQYIHGNQPAHNFPHLYYFVDRQEKSQQVLNTLLNEFYGVGEQGKALPGMDDGGEMSSWYVYNAMGFYPYSPAEDYYLVSVPLFDSVTIDAGEEPLIIIREGQGNRIRELSLDGEPLDDYRLPDRALRGGGTLRIRVE